MNHVKIYPLFFLFCFLFNLIAHAQNQPYKVGDRVMVSPTGLKEDKYWRPGTVTEVHNYSPNKAYSVACSAIGGERANTFVVTGEKLRPLAETTTTTTTTTTTVHQTTTNQPPAPSAAGRVFCPPSNPGSGNTVMERGIRDAVVAGFERKMSPPSDGNVTVDVQSLIIGPSHKWEEVVDPQAARGKNIYRVQSTFTTCTDYHTRIVVVKRERVFKCYKNDAGQWSCEVAAAANTNVKDESKSIDKN